MRRPLKDAWIASVLATPADALTFNPIDTGGTAVGTQARQGFEFAASYWPSVFTDNITINLQIGFSQHGAGILGITGSARSLFRFSSTGNLDWSTENTPYFSLDRGASQLLGESHFSTGVANGDGHQASHWKDSASGLPQLGILDPTSSRGQLQEITALDLAAYDAIGWNVSLEVMANSGYRFSTAQVVLTAGVPEPATWAMLIGGFGMVGGTLRRRVRRATVSFI